MSERDVEMVAVGLMIGMLTTCATVLVAYLLWWRGEQQATKRRLMAGSFTPDKVPSSC